MDGAEYKSVGKKIHHLVKNQVRDKKRIETWLEENVLLDHRQEIIQLNDRYAESYTQIQEMVHSLPQPGLKRILILCVLLVLCIGMLFFAHMLSQQ